MRPKSMILILIALGCGLIASIGISQVVERGAEEAAEEIQTNPIYVAMTDIDIGEELNAQRVKLEEWPIDRIPAGAVTTAEQIEGMAPRQRLFAGEPILLGKLANKDKLTSASWRIKPGHRVMSVKVSMDTAVSHLIQPGDHVDMLAFVRGRRGKSSTAEIVLSNIEVFAINSQTTRLTNEDGTTIQAKTVSLQVTPDQANKLVYYAEQGRLRLTLRSPDDKSIGANDEFNLTKPEEPKPTIIEPEPIVDDFSNDFQMQVLDGTGRARVFAWDADQPEQLPREIGVGVVEANPNPEDEDDLPPFQSELGGDGADLISEGMNGGQIEGPLGDAIEEVSPTKGLNLIEF